MAGRTSFQPSAFKRLPSCMSISATVTVSMQEGHPNGSLCIDCHTGSGICKLVDDKTLFIGKQNIFPSILGLPYVLLFDEKNLSSEDAKKWPNVFLFSIMNNENMSNHFPTKIFGTFQCKLRARSGRDDLFF